MIPRDLHPFILTHSSPLIRHLLERKTPLNNAKKKKTALILGAGGMRGAFGAGVIAALDSLGLQNVFDVVIGTSIGSIQGSYFLSGQGSLLPEIFLHNFADKRLIHLPRIHRIFDLHYFEEVLTKIKPLDQQAIKKSTTQFYVGMTNAKTAEGEYLHINTSRVDVLTAISASASIPLLQPKPVIINNNRYVDGFIGCKSPVAFAVEKGCTEILLVANNHFEDLHKKPLHEKLLINLLPYSPVLKKAVKSKKSYDRELYDDINHFSNKVTIGIIAPEDINFSILETDKRKLKPVVQDGYKKTIKLFS